MVLESRPYGILTMSCLPCPSIQTSVKYLAGGRGISDYYLSISNNNVQYPVLSVLTNCVFTPKMRKRSIIMFCIAPLLLLQLLLHLTNLIKDNSYPSRIWQQSNDTIMHTNIELFNYGYNQINVHKYKYSTMDTIKPNWLVLNMLKGSYFPLGFSKMNMK